MFILRTNRLILVKSQRSFHLSLGYRIRHSINFGKSKDFSDTAMMEGRPLKGKVAVVTGASSGIGKAISLRLASAGARIGLGARRMDQLVALRKEIIESGGEAFAVTTDVTKQEEVENLVSSTESTFGPVDILVNNAGVMYYTLMKNQQRDEWDRTIDVNCKGTLNGIGAVLNSMINRSRGHIVNISSDAGKVGFPGLAVYTGSKFFIEGMSKSLREELNGTGVRITCIQPGYVRTDLYDHNTDSEAKDKYDTSKGSKILEPDDVARAVVYAVTQPEYIAVNEILIQPTTIQC